MLSETLRLIFAREIHSAQKELEAYAEEAQIWALPPGVANSSGTLALHLAGNLRHFIGGVLGNTGYVRNREAEFALRDVPRKELLAELDEAAAAIDLTLSRLTPADHARDYPVDFGGSTLRTDRFLIHLESHLAYHLGQMDYHRRLVTGHAGAVSALPISALAG